MRNFVNIEIPYKVYFMYKNIKQTNKLIIE